MAYASGEVDLGLTTMQATPGAACIMATTTSTSVWFVSNAYLGGLTLGSTVIDAVAQGACADAGVWTSQAIQIDGWSGSALTTIAGLGLTVATNPVLVWNNGADLHDTRHGVWAAEYGGGSQPTRWASPVRLLTKDSGNPGINPWTDYVSVGATAWGPDTILVVCPQAGATGLFVGTYVLGQRDVTDGTWVAAYQTRISEAMVAAAVPGLPDLGETATCDWFPVGDTDANGPVGYLAIGLNPSSGGPVIGYLKIVVDSAGVPYVDPTTAVWDQLSGEGLATVARDPAGRLRVYALANGQLATLTFATAAAPAAGGSAGHALPLVRRDSRPAPHGQGAPAVAFAVMAGQRATFPTLATVVDGSGNTTVGPVMASQVPAYEVVFYENRAPAQGPPDPPEAWVYGQLGSFGWAQQVVGTGVPSLSATTAQPGAVIRGIIDGPVPIPLGNVTGAVELAELRYSATQTEAISHTSENSWTAGMKSTGEPTSGIGPVWDIAVSSGMGVTSGSTTSDVMTTSAAQPTTTFVNGSGETYMDQAGWVWVGQSAVTYAAYRWIESLGSAMPDRPAAQQCADGTYRVYARYGSRLFFYLGVPAALGLVQWAGDDVTWENDHQIPAAVVGVPALGIDPATSGGTGHVWTQDSFGSVLRFTQGTQGWTGLLDTGARGLPQLNGDPVPFLVGGVEHVVVVDNKGQVWDVHPGDGPEGWSADNLSRTQKSPMLCRTSPTAHPAVDVSDNGNGTWAVSVMFPSPQGHLVMLYNGSYPAASGWTYDDLSYEVRAAFNGRVTIDADVVRSGGALFSTGTMGSGTAGHLQQWIWQPPHGSAPAGWTCTDVSTLVGNSAGEPWPQMLGTCAILSSDPWSPGGLAVLGRRVDGHLLLMSQSGSQPWTHLDITTFGTGGVMCAGDPVVVDDCTAVVVATDGHLMWVSRPTATSAAWSMTDLSVATGLDGSAPAVISDGSSGVGQTPQWVNLSSTYLGDTASKYPLFGPVAGDLLSYTPFSWNSRMTALGMEWNKTAKATEVLYDGSDYLADVVLRYAQRYIDGTQTISAMWSAGPTVTEAFTAVQTGFVENTWTLDSSFYAGIGWGGLPAGEEAAGIFGEEAWSVMVGGSVHVSRTSTATDQTAWGISVSGPTSTDRWGPPPLPGAAGPGIVSNYAFDVYLLPPPAAQTPPSSKDLPPNYWTTELRAGLASLPSGASWPGVGYVRPEAIDPGSGAWKVICVLTSYTAGPTLTLDPPSPGPGQAVTLSGAYYGMDASPVAVTLTGGSLAGGVDLGSGGLDPNGCFGGTAAEPAVTVDLPSDLGPGTYTLTATTPTGPTSGTSTFTVAPQPG